MKKIVACICSFLFLFSNVFNVSILAETKDGFEGDTVVEENKDKFSQYVIPVYEKNANYAVITSSGIDVTSNFIEVTESFWLLNDYNAIKEYLSTHDLTVMYNHPDKKRSYSKSYSREFYKVVSGSGKDMFGVTRTDSGGEICWIVSGSATAGDNYQIISYSQPTLSSSSGITGWYPSSVSCSASKDRAVVNISYSFKANWTKTATSWLNCTYTSPTVSGSFTFTPVS